MERKHYFQVSRMDYKALFRQYRIYLKYKAMEKRIGDGNSVMSNIAAKNFLDYCVLAKIDFASIMDHIIRLRSINEEGSNE